MAGYTAPEMNYYRVSPAIGVYGSDAPAVYVVAETSFIAVEAAKLVTGERTAEGYKLNCWPVAKLTHFPKGAKIVNAVS